MNTRRNGFFEEWELKVGSSRKFSLVSLISRIEKRSFCRWKVHFREWAKPPGEAVCQSCLAVQQILTAKSIEIWLSSTNCHVYMYICHSQDLPEVPEPPCSMSLSSQSCTDHELKCVKGKLKITSSTSELLCFAFPLQCLSNAENPELSHFTPFVRLWSCS